MKRQLCGSTKTKKIPQQEAHSYYEDEVPEIVMAKSLRAMQEEMQKGQWIASGSHGLGVKKSLRSTIRATVLAHVTFIAYYCIIFRCEERINQAQLQQKHHQAIPRKAHANNR